MTSDRFIVQEDYGQFVVYDTMPELHLVMLDTRYKGIAEFMCTTLNFGCGDLVFENG